MSTTSTANLVHDNSTFANYSSWATFIDAAFLAFGWKQTPDTGQVQWLGCNISNCSFAGGFNTFTYSGLTTSGSIVAYAVGMVVNISGYSGGAAGNNGSYVITSVGSGTFTVANASGVTSATAVSITKQTTVPTGFVNSIWSAQDAAAATQPIVVKMAYGSSSSAVNIQATTGTGSDGSGNITGGVSSAPWTITSLTTNNGATTYPCFASGNAGNFRMIMWQTLAVLNEITFGIARAVDSSGLYTADYFTACSATANGNNGKFQTLAGSGNGPIMIGQGAWPASGINLTTANTGSTTASFAVYPFITKLGNPMLDYVTMKTGDVSDGATITVSSEYGATHTYIVINNLGGVFNTPFGGNLAIGMRYE